MLIKITFPETAGNLMNYMVSLRSVQRCYNVAFYGARKNRDLENNLSVQIKTRVRSVGPRLHQLQFK